MSLRALQGPTGGGAPVGGTGTSSPSTIPRWTGASTLGDSGLIDNGTAIYTTTRSVGIGTASPGTKLDVADTGTPSGTVGIRSLYTGTITANAGGVLALGGYFTGTSPTTFAYIVGGKDNATAGDFGGHLQFITRPNGGVYTERARIDSSGNVGIGVIPSAWASSVRAEEMRTHARWNYNSGSDSVAYWTVNAFLNSAGNAIYKATAAASQYTQIGGAHVWERAVSGTAGNTVTWLESARIDSNGNFAVGRVPTAGTIFETQGDQVTFRDAAGNVRFRFEAANSLLNIGIGSGWGLKLPATPGNGNANTLDSYQEGTRVLSAGDLSGWTYVTATQYWTLVGRTVTLHTVFTGGTSSATGGATIATPPLLTPLRIAAGAAVNSAGTALGNGVCVVASTSSTTGTVTTSNAISSSAVDKVITVTYETAGL